MASMSRNIGQCRLRNVLFLFRCARRGAIDFVHANHGISRAAGRCPGSIQLRPRRGGLYILSRTDAHSITDDGRRANNAMDRARSSLKRETRALTFDSRGQVTTVLVATIFLSMENDPIRICYRIFHLSERAIICVYVCGDEWCAGAMVASFGAMSMLCVSRSIRCDANDNPA